MLKSIQSMSRIFKSKSRPRGTASRNSDCWCGPKLADDFFQELLINVEVRVDVLHVVVVFERFDQPDHLRSLLALKLDVVLRNHRYARRRRSDAGLLNRLENRFV